jgi:hypothetical protein
MERVSYYVSEEPEGPNLSRPWVSTPRSYLDCHARASILEHSRLTTASRVEHIFQAVFFRKSLSQDASCIFEKSRASLLEYSRPTTVYQAKSVVLVVS